MCIEHFGLEAPMTDALAIFTGKGEETTLRAGGCQSWVLDRGNARQCKYAVLFYNTHAEWSDGNYPHGSAFLVGRISDVVPSEENSERWRVVFSEYAKAPSIDAWRWRNPIKYTTLEELGIDESKLKFRPMPSVAKAVYVAPAQGKLWTIADAKRELAKSFGVSPDAVEITIRG